MTDPFWNSLLTTHHVEEITPAFTHGLLLRKGRQSAVGELSSTMTSTRLSELFGLPVRIARRNGRWAAHVDGGL